LRSRKQSGTEVGGRDGKMLAPGGGEGGGGGSSEDSEGRDLDSAVEQAAPPRLASAAYSSI
jgi:hypothetical protein